MRASSSAPSRALLLGLLIFTATAQVVVDPASGFVMPMFDAETRFHEAVARSRWSANPMEYLDGASSAVLRHPYTIAHAPDGELFVASFTLNHVVRLRWVSGKLPASHKPTPKAEPVRYDQPSDLTDPDAPAPATGLGGDIR